jgi:hypothetical membrane protein
MTIAQRLKHYVKRYPLIGPIFWAVSIQYIVIQFIVAGASKSYSYARDAISDLGNTACGNFDGHYVCSPLHDLMNASFIILGGCIMIGSIFLYLRAPKKRPNTIGFASIAISGIGMIIVGFSPENLNAWLHITGAGIAFTAGALSMLILGRSLQLPKTIKRYALASGSISFLALFALAFIDFDSHFPGEGTIERLVVIPQVLWLIIFGGYIFYKELRRLYARRSEPRILSEIAHNQ